MRWRVVASWWSAVSSRHFNNSNKAAVLNLFSPQTWFSVQRKLAEYWPQDVIGLPLGSETWQATFKNIYKTNYFFLINMIEADT